MKTLIELYDERPLENVLGTDVFRPERTVILCPLEVASNEGLQKNLREFFSKRGVKTELVFQPVSLVDAGLVRRTLEKLLNENEDCVVDITGGTDAGLFAAGLVCAGRNVPVYTYSRRANRFYSIHNAEFAHNKLCEVQYSVEDCLRMAGGAMRMGRVDNALLKNYYDLYEPFFSLYQSFRREWIRVVSFIQKISQEQKEAPVSLLAKGPYRVKQNRGAPIPANEQALHEMQQLGMIYDLEIEPEEYVSFRFRDEQTRAWLRDIGSVLELYVWKAAKDSGLFHDVRSSVVVDWQTGRKENDVTNEIDVMATHGVVPVFISCKTCDVKTEALNELAVLRDRFGGQIARAAIVTAETGRAPMRHRAMELGIDVIDGSDLRSGRLIERLKALTRPY